MIKNKHYKQFTPTFAISSEYDAIIAIFQVYNLLIDKNYVKEIKINHVLGHQDLKKPYKDLKTHKKTEYKGR